MNQSGVRPKAVVIGAGFTGLTTAYFLERAGYLVEVYERSNRVGGLISTTMTEFGPSESAANAFINSARLEAFFKDLEISVVPAQKESRARYIFRGGKPRRWPLGVFASFRFFIFLMKYLFVRNSVAPHVGESLGSWGRRIFGEEVTGFFLLPAFQGIYAGDGRRLSASLVLGLLFDSRKKSRPGIRGSVAALGGMGEILSKLSSKLEERGVRIHLQTEGPENPSADVVYYCGSASQTADALTRVAPEFSRLLARIEMLPLVSLTAFFSPDSRVKRGFGALFPPSERFNSLGVLYNHVIFPGRVSPSEILSETWILGGARRLEITGLEENQILREVLADRGRLNGFGSDSQAPLGFKLHRWPKAIPYYTVELERVIEEISRLNLKAGKIRVMGNFLGGIGLTKIFDRIFDEIEKVNSK